MAITASRATRLRLQIARRVFCLLWILIFVFQCLNVLFLGTLAFCYLDFQRTESLINYLAYVYLFAQSQQFLQDYYVHIGVGYALLTLPFLFATVQMVWYSIKRRQLAFGSSMDAIPTPRRPRRKPPQPIKRTRTRVPEVGALMLAFAYAIDMRGRYFTQCLLAIETIEIVLQTVQAYQSSASISNMVINQCYGVIIFINCWSSPLLHYYWTSQRRDVMMERLMTVLVDAILDFVWGTIVQFLLLMPYWHLYWYSTTSEVVLAAPENSERELQQIIVLSFQTFVLSAFPFVTSAFVLRELRVILNDSQHNIRRVHAIHSNFSAIGHSTQSRSKSYVMPPAKQMIASAYQQLRVTSARVILAESQSLLTRCYLGFMMLYGLVILGISISASGLLLPTERSDTSCILQLYPWFSTHQVCVGRFVNCTALGIDGRLEELQNVLSQFEASSLMNLGFGACQSLEMSPMIHQFPALATLRMENVTLTQWNLDAAVTEATFSNLQTLSLSNVTIDCVPAGITKAPLPQTLEWISFYAVQNADQIFDPIEDPVYWQHVVYFYCEACGLTAVPPMVSSMTLAQEISLADNRITTIAADSMEWKPRMYWLVLALNPLVSVPDSVWRLMSKPLDLDLRYTNVTTIPSFALEDCNENAVIRGYAAPLCNETSRDKQQSCVYCLG